MDVSKVKSKRFVEAGGLSDTSSDERLGLIYRSVRIGWGINNDRAGSVRVTNLDGVDKYKQHSRC